ncbi:MAG: LD-carboxypeptidase [Thaumarchaeota archaeon]|nr:LD-carboxypeptidase [Nitrososphaerota archaeon]
MQKIKPPVLKKGATIGVPGPSSKPPNFMIGPGVQRLKRMGFNVVLGKTVRQTTRQGFLSGTDKVRAEEINTMFKDEKIDALLCARGGYGSIRILPYLDYDVIREHPKIIMGMSDITSLLLGIHAKTGLVTFHGPGSLGSLTGEFTPYTDQAIMKALMSTEPIGEVTNPPDGPFVQTVVEGTAVGELTGGNLNLVVATLGTPYEIDTKGRIFFFEIPGVRAWQIDRHLVHLEQAGKLPAAVGFVAGECVQSDPYERAVGEYWLSYPGAILDHHLSSTVEEVINERLSKLGKPAEYGLVCGHGRHKTVMPIGVRAELRASEGILNITESATTG